MKTKVAVESLVGLVVFVLLLKAFGSTIWSGISNITGGNIPILDSAFPSIMGVVVIILVLVGVGLYNKNK